MNESGKFDYDKPSPETLAGITFSFDDAEPTAQGPVVSQEAAAQFPAPPMGHPRPEDLVGITLTFEDGPGDARPDNLPPPQSASESGQPKPGS
jgi:hypothetical protein